MILHRADIKDTLKGKFLLQLVKKVVDLLNKIQNLTSVVTSSVKFIILKISRAYCLLPPFNNNINLLLKLYTQFTPTFTPKQQKILMIT